MIFNTNRLSLPNMVDKQLKEQPQGTEIFFSPNFVSNKSSDYPDDYRRKGYERTKLMTSFNSVVADIHSKLKSTRKPSQRESKDKSSDNAGAASGKSEACTPIPTPAEVISKKIGPRVNVQTTVMRMGMDPKSHLGINEHKLQTILNSKSIPKIKAVQEQRHQQRLRRTIQRYDDFPEMSKHRRVDEIAKQKRILENMLQQHQRLQRSRQSIASDIQLMRDHLTQIRDSLDISLRRFNIKTTIAERMPRRKKNSQVVHVEVKPSEKSTCNHTVEMKRAKSVDFKRRNLSPKRSIRSGSSTRRPSKSPSGVALNRSRSPIATKCSRSPPSKK